MRRLRRQQHSESRANPGDGQVQRVQNLVGPVKNVEFQHSRTSVYLQQQTDFFKRELLKPIPELEIPPLRVNNQCPNAERLDPQSLRNTEKYKLKLVEYEKSYKKLQKQLARSGYRKQDELQLQELQNEFSESHGSLESCKTRDITAF